MTCSNDDDVFQETSARYKAVKREKEFQPHPEAVSSWPSWPEASHLSPGVYAEVKVLWEAALHQPQHHRQGPGGAGGLQGQKESSVLTTYCSEST